jgi:small-conductance mechanosensitive channel
MGLKVPTRTLLVLALNLLLLSLLACACGSQSTSPAATSAVTPPAPATAKPETTGTPAGDGSAPSVAEVAQVGTAVADRTAVPTPTPGMVQIAVDQIATDLGLTAKTFLGLTGEDWLNLALSGLLVLAGYLVGGRLLIYLLELLVGLTTTKFDDDFLEATGGKPKWLVVLIVTRFATMRLEFLSDELRTLLDDIFFGLGWFLVLAIILRLVGFAVKWYQVKLESAEDRARLGPIIAVLVRIAYVLVAIVMMSIGLSHFGINVTAISAVLIFAAVILSLGAKDIISDAISGFIILIDQPFRAGDTIQIEELNKTGTVEEIGTRTTHVRIGDNRLVIVPNSTIGASQVINYSFPDTSYQVQIEIGVAYGSDFDQVRSLIHDAVRGIDGVLPDKPVDALIRGFGDSSRTMRVRWWIDDVNHEAPIVDRVCEALERALDGAAIDMPFVTEKIILSMDAQTKQQLSLPPGEPNAAVKPSATGNKPDGSDTE